MSALARDADARDGGDARARDGARRVTAERFERIYADSADPWGYADSDYERAKYADTLATLPSRPIARALEVGCSIGVFTELLAQHCEELVAIDFSARAIRLASERLGKLSNVRLLRASFPEQTPPGRWDLVVCSEVLYYLDRDALREATAWLAAQLADGASVVAVSWRGRGLEEPLLGDEAHDLLARELASWHSFDGREDPQAGRSARWREHYRIDRFDATGGYSHGMDGLDAARRESHGISGGDEIPSGDEDGR